MDDIVKKIIAEVKKNKDRAVKKYTRIFDKVKIDNFRVSKQEISKAYKEIDKDTLNALKKAKNNIRKFAGLQRKQFKDFEYKYNGITLGQKFIPIERVGAYVPGGNYPLPSTALMCTVPAKVAGVKKIVVCSPKIKPITIVAADLGGADSIFNVGGIQAVAAMAYGTETIPKVDKIVGPGNIYVTAAKKEIYGDCGIDLLAGPSEILIIADKYANAKFIAADLLAQAEHDTKAKITFITDSAKLIKEVVKQIKTQLCQLETKEIIQQSIRNKKIIKVKELKEAVELANENAPEHLELCVKNPKSYVGKLKNYGSLFLGEYSAVAFGDYCSGTNHVLPTQGNARFTGGLSVRDFLKLQTYQYLSQKGAKLLSNTAVQLASTEGLTAHKKSVEARILNNK